MLSLTDRISLRAAALNGGLDPHLRAVLRLRFEQLGGSGAHFHVVQHGDDIIATEAAVGFPLTMDDEPTWEWTQRHGGGWVEIVLVLSNDGPAQVVLVRDADGTDPELIRFLHDHAAPAADQEAAETA